MKVDFRAWNIIVINRDRSSEVITILPASKYFSVFQEAFYHFHCPKESF